RGVPGGRQPDLDGRQARLLPHPGAGAGRGPADGPAVAARPGRTLARRQRLPVHVHSRAEHVALPDRSGAAVKPQTGRRSQVARSPIDNEPRTKPVLGSRFSVLTPTRLLALGIVCYIIAFTLAAWYKYATYQMGFDLGVHEQVLWNTAHGRIAATSAF